MPATIVGTNSSDVLLGNPAGMLVPGGNDIIRGWDGDDAIGGEGGRDLIDAGAGTANWRSRSRATSSRLRAEHNRPRSAAQADGAGTPGAGAASATGGNQASKPSLG